MKNKGFTIIELVFVIVVIGVLMLIAKPNLMRNVEKTKLTHIAHDIKMTEDVVETKITIDKMPDNWVSLESLNLDKVIKDKKVYELKGVAKEIQGTKYQKISDDWTRSKLPGVFYANEDAKVYYIDN